MFDRLGSALIRARLWLFDLIHGPEPLTPADERREADSERLRKALPGWLPEDREREAVTMTMHLIGCALQPSRDYAALANAIEGLGDTRKCLESTWLVSTEHNASEIKEYLSDYLADGDKIIVIECGRVASWAGLNPELTEWFMTRI